jgi:hypothetical protein
LVEPKRYSRFVRFYEEELGEFRAFYRQRLPETASPTPVVIEAFARGLRRIVGTKRNRYWSMQITNIREELLPVVDKILADWAALKGRPIEGPPFVDEVQKKQKKVVKPALELKIIGREFEWREYDTTLSHLRFDIKKGSFHRDKDHFRKRQLMMVSDVYRLCIHIAREHPEKGMTTLTFSLPPPEEWDDPDKFRLYLQIGLLPDLQRLIVLAKYAISLFEGEILDMQFSHSVPVDFCLECVQNRCNCSEWDSSFYYSLGDVESAMHLHQRLFWQRSLTWGAKGPVYADNLLKHWEGKYWDEHFGEG